MCFAFVVAFSIIGGASIFGNDHDKSEIWNEIATGRGARFAIFMGFCGLAIMLTVTREALVGLSDDKIANYTKRIINALIEESVAKRNQRTKLSKRMLESSISLLDEAVEVKNADPNDQVSALFHRAITKYEQNDKDAALEDLMAANQISEVGVDWKWKIYLLVGQIKLDLLDFQGYVDSLNAALKAGYDNQGKVDNARLLLERSRFGLGSTEGIRHELARLIDNEGVDTSHK